MRQTRQTRSRPWGEVASNTFVTDLSYWDKQVRPWLRIVNDDPLEPWDRDVAIDTWKETRRMARTLAEFSYHPASDEDYGVIGAAYADYAVAYFECKFNGTLALHSLDENAESFDGAMSDARNRLQFTYAWLHYTWVTYNYLIALAAQDQFVPHLPQCGDLIGDERFRK
jgi:hypothetical protein